MAELEARYAELSREQAPALVDQAVLNLARRELARERRVRNRAMRWIGAFSTVSILLITLGVVVQQYKQAQPLSPGNGSNDVAPASQLPARETFRLEQAKPAREQGQARMGKSAAASAERTDHAVSADEDRQRTPDHASDPDAWLHYILQLKQEGLGDRAASELRAFRQAYPDYPLPESLRD